MEVHLAIPSQSPPIVAVSFSWHARCSALLSFDVVAQNNQATQRTNVSEQPNHPINPTPRHVVSEPTQKALQSTPNKASFPAGLPEAAQMLQPSAWPGLCNSSGESAFFLARLDPPVRRMQNARMRTNNKKRGFCVVARQSSCFLLSQSNTGIL